VYVVAQLRSALTVFSHRYSTRFGRAPSVHRQRRRSRWKARDEICVADAASAAHVTNDPSRAGGRDPQPTQLFRRRRAASLRPPSPRRWPGRRWGTRASSFRARLSQIVAGVQQTGATVTQLEAYP